MGRLFGIYEGGKPSLVVAEPDLVKQVLVKDFQLLPNRRVMTSSDPIFDNMMVFSPVESWRRIRPAASPAFSTGKLRKMNSLIQDCARITCGHLKAAAEKERDVDIKQFYGHYTVDMIARCAFGTKLDSHTDVTNEFVTQARSAFSPRLSFSMLIAVLFPGLLKTFSVLNPGAAVEYFRKVCQRIISNRRQNGKRQEDFLQLMMDAQDGSLAPTDENPAGRESELFDIGTEGKLESMLSSKRLTEVEAMAQCVLFFLAGQDTTSSTLAFAAYLLALHPDVQEKLRTEVDECMAVHGPEPGLDVISRLKYLHCVTSEALRLYPPAARLQRIAHEDYVLGDTRIKVPKDCAVVIPIYAMHRDPEFFPDPESFNPERFSDENVDAIRPYTYLPFGAGPRNCVGMRLALQAVKLCLLHSVHSVQFVRTENTKVPLKIKRGLGVLTAEDITVGIRRRPDKQSRLAR
ncbi:cytochrome P450 3A24-like isoform X2 [Haemaphysalis longicornis]